MHVPPAPHGVPDAHSSMSTHVAERPEPDAVKPEPHEHVYPPEVFEQPFTEPPPSVRPHCAADIVHSLTSTHVAVRPEPMGTKPAPQLHV